jgi:hypothetical protein
MRWGIDQWGTLWGDGTRDTQTKTLKAWSESIGSDSSVVPTNRFVLTLANALVFLADLASESMTDGNGYSLVYPGGSTNAENRSLPNYSTAAAVVTTYSSSSAGTTVWS